MNFFKWLIKHTNPKKAEIELFWFLIYIGFSVIAIVHAQEYPRAYFGLIASGAMILHQYLRYKAKRSLDELPGLEKVVEARLKQFKKGYSKDWDLQVNHKSQLVRSAKVLLDSDQTYRELNRPLNWDSTRWNNIAHKSEDERIAIAAALLCAELDRREILAKVGQVAY